MKFQVKNPEWIPYFYYKNPLNLLFSSDQFLSEFLGKYPQRKKISAYKIQLKEQKKLSLFYGYLSKKQLRKYLVESTGAHGEFSKNFIRVVERRLDVILYRSQFVKNIATARQLISHKKVVVNHKIISIPSYLVTPGDVISIPKYLNLQAAQTLRTTLKSQNFSDGTPEISHWKFQSKFLSKKQIQVFTWLLAKKIHARAEFQPYQNPFGSSNQYSRFHIYILSSPWRKSNFEMSKKIIFKTLSNFPFHEISKEIFFVNVKKYVSKRANFFGAKPHHLEVSYRLSTIVFLYSPQRVYYPFLLDLDLFTKK